MREYKKDISLNSREDFENLAKRIMEPLIPYYSKGKARLKIGNTAAHYPEIAAQMEGFSRPLWALGPMISGGGVYPEFVEIYRQGLISGTDPNHPEYWGPVEDYDQRLVEMAAIAYALILAPETFYEPLNLKEKENLVNWLNQINVKKCYDCNWRFFNVLVNMVLKKLGVKYSESELNDALDYVEKCYLGDGWYGDGEPETIDYYGPFAFHFYGLFYAGVMKNEDPKRCEEYLKRAEIFGKDFAYWFADNGAAVAYGRSLTYRFAQVAFYSMCVQIGIEPIPMAEMKWIISGNLKYWMSLPIFDNSGLLTIGYGYPNLIMAEGYNAPGSPYWAMKTFAILALNKEHPFWKVEARPLSGLKKETYLVGAKMHAQRRKDGEAVLFPGRKTREHLHTHTEEKYDKFAYSTKYAFNIAKSGFNLAENAPDSVLTFKVFGYIFTRGHEEVFETDEKSVKSTWSPIEGIKVKTEIIPCTEGHIRKHHIESAYDCTAYEAGFALPPGDEDGCRLKVLAGEGENICVTSDPNTNILHPKTVIPMIAYPIKKGGNYIETLVMYD